MSITHELRKWASGSTLSRWTLKKLIAIADRIDVEHERRCREQYACGAEDGISVSIDALVIQTHGFIELPKDADGEYIHIGDKVTCGASVWEVTGFRLTGGFWGICCTIFNDQGGSGTNVYPPSDLHHYHAPTVEDVLEDFYRTAKADSDANWGDLYETIAEYAAKLRLAEGEDE